MKKLTVGALEIFSLTDAEADIPLTTFFPDIQAEQWFAYQHVSPLPSFTGDEFLHARVGAYLVRSSEYVLLVDTGLGLGATTTFPLALSGQSSSLKKALSGLPVKLLEELQAAGVKPEDVDMVFLTHAHLDHYGWNLTYEGKPLFPNARYLLSRADWDAFQHPAMPAPIRWELEHFVAPLSRRGMLELVSEKQSLFHDIQVLPTPGHSPGHMSLFIDAGGQQVLIGGDTFVHPLQIADVTVCFSADMHHEQAIATRKQLREWIAQESILLASSHIAGSGVGRIFQDTHDYIWQEQA